MLGLRCVVPDPVLDFLVNFLQNRWSRVHSHAVPFTFKLAHGSSLRGAEGASRSSQDALTLLDFNPSATSSIAAHFANLL
jgi:hypothetical protein